MLKTCEVQKNVNMTIKEGSKRLKSVIQNVREKLDEAKRKEEVIKQGFILVRGGTTGSKTQKR